MTLAVVRMKPPPPCPGLLLLFLLPLMHFPDPAEALNPWASTEPDVTHLLTPAQSGLLPHILERHSSPAAAAPVRMPSSIFDQLLLTPSAGPTVQSQLVKFEKLWRRSLGTVDNNSMTLMPAQQQQLHGRALSSLPFRSQRNMVAHDECSCGESLKRSAVRSRISLFVLFRAYRLNTSCFAVIGHTGLKFGAEGGAQAANRCKWEFRKGLELQEMIVSTKIFQVSDRLNRGRPYHAIVIFCNFEKDVGVDERGGVLLLSYNRHKGDDFVVLRENPGDIDAIFSPPALSVSVCSCRNSGPQNPALLHHWYLYHHQLLSTGGGSHHFFVYSADNPLHESLQSVIEPYIRAGLASVVLFHGQDGYRSAYNHFQPASIVDCLYKTRFMSNFTFFFDHDEFFFIPPPASLSQVLKEYENFSGVLVATLLYSRELCLWEGEPSTSESMATTSEFSSSSSPTRMVWRRHALDACADDDHSCDGRISGGKKFYLRPRDCVLAYNHGFVSPGKRQGYFNASMAAISPRLLHFQHVASVP
eukprot:TRINITY_DN2998_c0_g1_i3.p1 TRINITY_DN2998_c0_g1~~TRINITY_DN2998_c0_g1_i3.p1  ORF type:complete len:530 (+),score=98.74 TRINITY_DN2998_c0_g1_i3:46-1635(+)